MAHRPKCPFQGPGFPSPLFRVTLMSCMAFVGVGISRLSTAAYRIAPKQMEGRNNRRENPMPQNNHTIFKFSDPLPLAS